MTTTNHKAYTQTATNALTTGLDSLANNTNSAASAAIDNTTNLDLFMDIELILAAQGSARSSGAYVAVYMAASLDGGTNFADAHETTAQLVATFPLDAATTARRCMATDIPIPPGQFKLFVRNATGQAFAASGSSLRYRTHSIATA